MKSNSQDLEKIADLTLDRYNQNAEDFWEGTRYHDVSQNIAAMLQYINSRRATSLFRHAPLRVAALQRDH
jgi:hypothetical protein